MSNPASSPTPSPAADPAASPAATPPADIPVTADLVEQAIRDGDVAQLEKLMDHVDGMRASGAPKPAAAAQPGATDPAPAKDKEPAAAAEPGADPEEGAPATKNFRMVAASDKEAEVFRLMKEAEAAHRADPSKPLLTLEEAFKQVFKPAAAAATPAADPEKKDDPPAEDPFKKHDEAIAGIDTRLADAEARLKTALEDANTDEVLKINREIRGLDRERTKAEDAKERAQADQKEAAQSKVDAAAREDYGNVLKRFPMLASPKDGEQPSKERADFETFVKERSAHPDYEGIFASPRWRSILAREWAELRGVDPVGKAAVPPAGAPKVDPAQKVDPLPSKNNAAPPTASKPRASAADVVGAADAPPAASFEVTPESVAKDLDSITDPKQLDRLMNEVDSLRRKGSAARR